MGDGVLYPYTARVTLALPFSCHIERRESWAEWSDPENDTVDQWIVVAGERVRVGTTQLVPRPYG
jgi:hypothetical protein